MRFYEFNNKKPSFNLTEAARIAHAEDLVFFEGSAGALRAVANISGIDKNRDTLSIKWDGCIHPDHILQTDCGELRIEEVIDRVNSGNDISVLAFDFNDNKTTLSTVINGIKKTGTKDWVAIELENGDMLTLTEDHEVYTTNRGWVAAKDLTSVDDIKEL